MQVLNTLRLLCAHVDNCGELLANFAAVVVRIVRNFEVHSLKLFCGLSADEPANLYEW